MCATRLSSRYRCRSSSQKRKKLGSGRQSSSRMIAWSTVSKTQSRPLDTRRRQPMFASAYFVSTSQSQSTWSMMARVTAHASASPGRFARGPSATTSSFGGLAWATAANTRRVVAGRLKMTKATGVCSCQSDNVDLSRRSARVPLLYLSAVSGFTAFDAEAVVPPVLVLHCAKHGVGSITKECPPDATETRASQFWFDGLVVPHPKMLSIAEPPDDEVPEASGAPLATKASLSHEHDCGFMCRVAEILPRQILQVR